MEKFFEGLTKEQISIIKKQIEKFESLRKINRQQIIPKNTPILPQGTLIHGTIFNEKTLKSIADSGIITGQYFGIEEDGETYFCADFHRVSEETSLEDYNNKFSHNDGRCPFGQKGKNTLAFIIHPTKELEEIIKYDCYRENTEESRQTKIFVNERGLPIEDKNKASSVLFGVPSCFINGIILGDNLINKDIVEFLRNTFPNCYLLRNNGQVIFRQNDTEKVLNLQIETIQKTIENEKKEKEIKSLESQIKRMQDQNQKIWDSIAKLPLENIALIYKLIGWQGDTMEFAKKLKEEKNKGEKRK